MGQGRAHCNLARWRGEPPAPKSRVLAPGVPSKQLLNAWLLNWFSTSGRRTKLFCGCGSKQTTNLASINMTQLRSFALPIPPLDEQQRILSALSNLTTHCHEWRRQVGAQAGAVRRFLPVQLFLALPASMLSKKMMHWRMPTKTMSWRKSANETPPPAYSQLPLDH